MKKRCNRRRYDPRLHPMRLAAMAEVVPPADWRLMQLRELFAMDALKTGRAAKCDLHQLLATVETARELARAGLGAEHEPALSAASGALRRISIEAGCGTVAATATELRMLREALVIADLQRDVVPRRDHERAAVRAMQALDRRR